MYSHFVLTVLLILFNADHASASQRSYVNQFVEKMIQGHQMVLFSKTYCSYSHKMKHLLRKYHIRDQRIIELDLEPNMHLIQDYLMYRTGGIRTVPQLYIKGRFIGGFDSTHAKERNGELATIFARAGITHKSS
ncbi:unnamed protein product [Thelazia callipaeda]|uniref:Glutaredoxin domain-containing protein n=1 Tax=Thelazia callipaeda TaxID=103827 RepID=A0A158RD38_THECL|nr:unnamed protein product [Thelazia callipaeda]